MVGPHRAGEPVPASLENGSRVGVIGGGPSGSFFSHFLLSLADRIGKTIEVDVFEPRDFGALAPQGCNMCGGIVSESLVQMLATEGIELPPTVLRRGIDAYALHMDVGSVSIETPTREKRIAAVYRGPGPRDSTQPRWRSFDGHLLSLAESSGARVLRHRVTGVRRNGGRPEIDTGAGTHGPYDLVAVAVGVNASALKFLEGLDLAYRPPGTTKTMIREYNLGEDDVARYIGTSMHVFLLNIPRLEFAAIIPKGPYATVCLLGESIDRELIQAFFDAPEVRRCLPPDWTPEGGACQCSPRINVDGAARPFTDRLVFIGDCGVTRLYKDGIGAAYRTAKAAASTAIFHGVSESDFERHYRPACRRIATDNRYGQVAFMVTRQIQRRRYARRALWRMVRREQEQDRRPQRMSRVLWDLFTGSESYRNVFMRTLHPAFLAGLARGMVQALPDPRPREGEESTHMGDDALGAWYEDGQVIVRQGDVGEGMYVIEDGEVDVFLTQDGREVRLRTLGRGEFIGEMALFGKETRSATVRARGRVRLISVDKRNLLRRIHEDPPLAFRIIESLARRVRELSSEVAALRR